MYTNNAIQLGKNMHKYELTKRTYACRTHEFTYSIYTTNNIQYTLYTYIQGIYYITSPPLTRQYSLTEAGHEIQTHQLRVVEDL